MAAQSKYLKDFKWFTANFGGGEVLGQGKMLIPLGDPHRYKTVRFTPNVKLNDMHVFQTIRGEYRVDYDDDDPNEVFDDPYYLVEHPRYTEITPTVGVPMELVLDLRECWGWMGAMEPDPLGHEKRVTEDGNIPVLKSYDHLRPISARRYYYLMTRTYEGLQKKGDITPKGLQSGVRLPGDIAVLSLCGNPRCTNPRHALAMLTKPTIEELERYIDKAPTDMFPQAPEYDMDPWMDGHKHDNYNNSPCWKWIGPMSRIKNTTGIHRNYPTYRHGSQTIGVVRRLWEQVKLPYIQRTRHTLDKHHRINLLLDGWTKDRVLPIATAAVNNCGNVECVNPDHQVLMPRGSRPSALLKHRVNSEAETGPYHELAVARPRGGRFTKQTPTVEDGRADELVAMRREIAELKALLNALKAGKE